MRRLSRSGPAWLLFGWALLSGGCNNQDTERLARMGRKAAARVEVLTAGVNHKLATGWQAVRADLDEMALDARVSARLRWDKNLANTPIQIQAREGQVELRGTVHDLEQRRRAVELAES